MNDPIKIVKLIVNTMSNGFSQHFAVLNRMPEFKYTKTGHLGSLLVAEDSGFYSCYRYEKPTNRWRAFAGQEFEIPLENGTLIKASGEWWDAAHPKTEDIKTINLGINTEDRLRECFVFMSGCFNRRLFDEFKAAPIEYLDYQKYLKETK